jgi:hypothetical protein
LRNADFKAAARPIAVGMSEKGTLAGARRGLPKAWIRAPAAAKSARPDGPVVVGKGWKRLSA